MFPHIHLMVGFILADCLKLKDLPLILFILGSVIPDFDIIFGILRKKNHRTFFSHFPLIWLFLTLISVILQLDAYWFFVAGFIHLLVDVLDWEVFLLGPFLSFSWSLFSLNPETILIDKTFREQIGLYYQQKQIIWTELIIFGMTIVSLILS